MVGLNRSAEVDLVESECWDGCEGGVRPESWGVGIAAHILYILLYAMESREEKERVSKLYARKRAKNK